MKVENGVKRELSGRVKIVIGLEKVVKEEKAIKV